MLYMVVWKSLVQIISSDLFNNYSKARYYCWNYAI